jgi:hypothetical protein
MVKYIIFFFHYLFIFYVLYPFSPYNSIVALLVYISWIYNKNYCILSQIEYKYFNETFILSTKLKPISKYKKYLLLISQFIKLIFLVHNTLMLQGHNYFQLPFYYYQ